MGSPGPSGPPGSADDGKQAVVELSPAHKKMLEELLDLLAEKNVISAQDQIKLTSHLY